MNKNRDLTKKESILGERPSPGKETIAEFLEALSSKNPIPSGGGATALAASLAFSLALMVGNLTLGKKKYVHYEERLKIRMQEWEEGKKTALRLAKEDEEAFMPLAKAYALPKETEEEKEIYRERMEECLDYASYVPLQLLKLCAETAKSGRGIKACDIRRGNSGRPFSDCHARFRLERKNQYKSDAE